MNSTFLYGANVNANGIRQHYLRYGGAQGVRAGRTAVIVIPGITSPAVTWGFVGEVLGRTFDTYVIDVRGQNDVFVLERRIAPRKFRDEICGLDVFGLHRRVRFQ